MPEADEFDEMEEWFSTFDELDIVFFGPTVVCPRCSEEIPDFPLFFKAKHLHDNHPDDWERYVRGARLRMNARNN